MMLPLNFAATRRSRLALFGALYFAQGLPWGFLSVTLALKLSSTGYGPQVIGRILSLAFLPWTVKPLLGLLADKIPATRFGKRRPWILAAQTGMVATLLALVGIDIRTELELFIDVLVAHNIFAAAQDVGTDAMAIDVLPDAERGKANGVMSATKYAGVVVGGSGFSAALPHIGWNALFIVMAAVTALVSLLPLATREPPVALRSERTLLRDVFRTLLVPVVLVALLYVLIEEVGGTLLTPLMIPLFQRRFGFTAGDIATITLVSGAVAALMAIPGGFLADRLGRRRAIAIATATAGLVYVTWSVLLRQQDTPPRPVLYALVVLEAASTGILNPALLSLCMSLANPRIAATQFSAFLSIMNFRNSMAVRVGGDLAESWPAPRMFGLAALAQVLPLLLLPFLDAAKAQRAFQSREATPTGSERGVARPTD